MILSALLGSMAKRLRYWWLVWREATLTRQVDALRELKKRLARHDE